MRELIQEHQPHEQEVNGQVVQERHILDHIQEYKEGLGHFQQKMPEVADKYMEFTGVCFKDGALDKKTKQLIALGTSIVLQDEYCIMYHIQEALHHGATEQEIYETVGVSAAFGGGASFSQGVTLVQNCLVELR